MNILNVTSETLPFSKSGGLADVVSSLSESLSKTNTVKIMMPFYGFIEEKGFTKVQSLELKMLSKTEQIDIYSCFVGNVE